MKITKARVQQIIAEEYKRALYEGALSDKAQSAATNQQAPEQPASKEKDTKNRGQLAMNFKQELSDLVRKATGITGDEATLLQNMVVFIINAFHKKPIDDKKTEAMKKKIIQTIGQLQGDQQG